MPRVPSTIHQFLSPPLHNSTPLSKACCVDVVFYNRRVKSAAGKTGLRLKVVKDYQAMSRLAADFVAAEARSKPDLLLCASAGGTPTGMYERMARLNELKPSLFGKMRVVQIDEWGGLNRGNAASCRTDLEKKLLWPLAINGARFKGFVSDAPDAKQECANMARWLAAHGPIDVCLLGLGLNGHVAMNEPADEFEPGVHVSKLARRSLGHGMLKDLDNKPRYGLSMGLGDILRSRKILLVVSGETKREALKRLIEGPVSGRFPASFLWLHSDVTVICDREARGEKNDQ